MTDNAIELEIQRKGKTYTGRTCGHKRNRRHAMIGFPKPTPKPKERKPLRASPKRIERERSEWARDREAKPAAKTEVMVLHRGVYERIGEPAATQPKRQPAKRAEPAARIRESAKGEQCTVRLPGCQGDPAMTIWSHYRGSAGGKGMGIKALDLNGCYACTFCDAVYDGQTPRPAGMTHADVQAAWDRGHHESLVKLNAKGLV